MASTLGTHSMRSEFPLPDAMRGFPALLRAAGYYTSNNVKTDYNTSSADSIVAASWDESSPEAHWRKRESGQPFFAVFNLMTSHQSRTMAWSYQQFREEVQSKLTADQIHDPADAPVPPYYPDTPVIRKTLARYYDCVTAMDAQVGQILRQLEEDGLADDTIVFFYSDHGSGMPRHKRALLDTGMHVPLLIRFPEKYRDLAANPAGKTTDRLVNFEDFGPTVLSLAGLGETPAWMRGRAFLGEHGKPSREYVFGHRDRVDEVVDMARSVRDKRYLYIRNYMPHLGYNQPSAWPDQGEIRHEFYRLANPRKMTAPQWHFAGPTRPREELYDCREDPLNLRNLADSAEHLEVLRRMRGAHREWVVESRDLGFLPEVVQRQVATDTTPYEWARREDAYDVGRCLAAAELVGTDRYDDLAGLLTDDDPAIRYWAAVGCSAAATLPPDLLIRLTPALADSSAIVRIEAAGALARHGRATTALPVLKRLLQHDDATVVLHAARTVELLGVRAAPIHAAMRELADRYRDNPGDIAWFIRFSTEGFLSRVSSDAAKIPPHVDSQTGIPSDAVVIFAGKATDMLSGPDGGPCNWPVTDGVLVCDSRGQQRQQGLWTRLHFHDAQIHAEFLVPRAKRRGGNSGNSGLYLHGLFEHQILDSFRNPTPPMQMVGSVYGIRPPLVNAARRPEQWQTYDIIFRAPRRDAAGKAVKPGSITTMLNGILVQQNTRITQRVSKYAPLYFRTTAYTDQIRESLLHTGSGPLQLQDHDNPVRFRNIWIRPLDDKAFVFKAADR